MEQGEVEWVQWAVVEEDRLISFGLRQVGGAAVTLPTPRLMGGWEVPISSDRHQVALVGLTSSGLLGLDLGPVLAGILTGHQVVVVVVVWCVPVVSQPSC